MQAEAISHAVPTEFTWRGLTFELEHLSDAEPEVGLVAGFEYVCQLAGDGYVTVWSHDGGERWCAQLESSAEAGEPLGEGGGASREEALQQLVTSIAGLKRIIADFEGRLQP